MSWNAKLVGGPFEGDSEEIEVIPIRIWVTFCPRCGSHWYDRGPKGERYRRDTVDGDDVTYIFEDANLSAPRIETKEREKVPA